MEQKTFAQYWADLISSAIFATGKGEFKKSYKLTERNALKHEESRRTDKIGTNKHHRSYQNRYRT